MKKLIMIVAGLALVFSGVAAVSAYEAHIVNIKAHVENVLALDGAGTGPNYKFELGTIFPEEWIKNHITIKLSSSALTELRETQVAGKLKSVTFAVYLEKKVKEAGPPVVYYPWLGDAMWIGTGVDDWPKDTLGAPSNTEDGNTAYPAGDLAWGGPAPVAPAIAKLVPDAGGTLNFATQSIMLGIGVDTPVFEGYYNAETDMLQADGTYIPKPSKRDSPTVIIPKTDTERYFPDGVDLGVDLKVQVTNIVRW